MSSARARSNHAAGLVARSVAVLGAALAACGDASTALDATDAGPGDASMIFDASSEPAALRSLRVGVVGSVILAPGTTSTVTATGVFTDGSELDLTRAATWRSSSSTTAEVLAGGVLRAIAPGIAELRAARGAIESPPLRVEVRADAPPPGPTELRGVWVTRWSYSSAADLEAIVDEVDAANLNAIFFQVRGVGDAYYRSSLEPWASRLGGALGSDPGWDPLATILTAAHAKGIQVHAWFNTFPAWSGTTPPAESTPRHALLAHPEWLCADGSGTPMPPAASGYQFFSPGNPEVRAHVADVVEDLATSYDVDGLHMDFIRYPDPQYSRDAVSEALFADAQSTDPTLARADWQRGNITALVAELRARVERARPTAALTVASWGIYTNEWGWSSVSRGYDDYYQDAHRWAEEGLVDALCPMIYWELTSPKGLRTDFATLTDHHLAAAERGGALLFSGIEAGHSTAELEAQIEYVRAAGGHGFVLFDLSLLRSNGHLARLASGVLAERVAPPTKRP